MIFQNLPCRAYRQLLIPRIAAVGTSFSPLPCQARHGYRVTSAHRVEVEVGAGGPASAPLSGAAAAAPPAGAHTLHLCVSIGVPSRRLPGPIVLLRVLDGKVLMAGRNHQSVQFADIVVMQFQYAL
jgi:hypothetical protein